MRKKIFSKLIFYIIIALMVFATTIKVSEISSEPKVRDYNYINLQKIDKTKANFTFDVFADNKNSITTFNELIQRVNNDNSLFAVDDGDLVFEGDKEKFMFFLDQVENLKKPLLTVIGNHETYDEGRINYYHYFGRFYYSFHTKNSYFIMLDDANETDIDPWQMNWLKEELQKSESYKYRFVFMHVPLFDPSFGVNSKIQGHSLKCYQCALDLNNLFDRHHVTMLFVSHIHAYYRGVWSHTPYILTGGAGAELDGSDPTHFFYHYIKVNVSNNGVQYKVVKLDTPKLDLINRWVHNAWIYIYAFFSINFWSLIIELGVLYFLLYFLYKKKKWVMEIILKVYGKFK